MKKIHWCSVFILCAAALAGAQDIDSMIKKAIDNLAAPLNSPIEVSIGALTIDGPVPPTSFPATLCRR
jgi:hypothetical protein